MAAESSPLLKGFTQVMSGRAEAKQLGMEGLMYRRQADDVDLQSVQASERRLGDFRASLASVTANRAARGISSVRSHAKVTVCFRRWAPLIAATHWAKVSAGV